MPLCLGQRQQLVTGISLRRGATTPNRPIRTALAYLPTPGGGRRRFGEIGRRDGRREGAATAGIFEFGGRAAARPMVSARRSQFGRFTRGTATVRLAEATRSVELPEEQQPVDLLELPAGPADVDARDEGRQVGRLVRRQAPQEEETVGRSGPDAVGARLRLRPGRGASAGARPARGGRREHRR